ncbi:MAG: response regulator [Bacteroidetes bacterium]|nr:response regulator [Bacteroidota bacterium]
MPKFKTVLLVDDNEIDNFINERIILSSKFSENVVVRNSADGALNYLREIVGQEDKIPQFIFLDLNMPVKDGFGFLEDFDKIDEKIRKSAKVIVLSSSISPEDINKASTNPFVFKYINKPLSEKYLGAI